MSKAMSHMHLLQFASSLTSTLTHTHTLRTKELVINTKRMKRRDYGNETKWTKRKQGIKYTRKQKRPTDRRTNKENVIININGRKNRKKIAAHAMQSNAMRCFFLSSVLFHYISVVQYCWMLSCKQKLASEWKHVFHSLCGKTSIHFNFRSVFVSFFSFFFVVFIMNSFSEHLFLSFHLNLCRVTKE